ncbi:Transposon TX1 uncharacterized 149 kDa protein [Vitis vinifera]|uniref:Transposon TX1 uncharacterized 149 kDa protein n=1 Tax=Vitis vinifera TaxID=29760 RepID=A0A438K443_VITVI|nr:Transposon TX1 uncharacterized 149 kDa protein [Vitis vinifera]
MGCRQQALQCSVAERAIMDEALRYSSNLRAVDSSSSSSTFFGRTPERESCDHSGETRAGLQKESKMELAALGGPSARVGRFLDWRTIEAAGAAGGCYLLGQEVFGAVGVGGGPILNFLGKKQAGRISPAMRRFAQVMDDLELIDLPLQGGSFTWSGGFQNQAWARWTGPSPFRFENMWLKVEGFKDLLRSWWQGCQEVFGNLESNKMAALQQVDYWDQVESERGLIEEELSRKKEVKDDYAKWVKLEEIHWRQLSRELWLREGDRNTGYFHRMANAHRRRQTMEKIRINGADIGGLDLNQISQQEADTLELPFTEEEVHSALMGMNGDKAPGPDGFTGAFWQFCWEFVKEDFGDVQGFHEQKAFLKSLNTTFLVLIPKKGGAEELGDFRPISLVGGLYKLLAKVLANRIKNVVGKVVSSDQNAFVMDRQILDASLIANEVIDSWKKRGEKGLICKLDIEKAYDSVNWQFLMRLAFSPALRASARRPIPILVHYGNGGVERLYSEGCGRGLHFRVQDPEGQGAGCEYLPPSFCGRCHSLSVSCLQLIWDCPWVRPIRLWRVGWGGGKDEVEVGPLEAAIHIKGRKNCTHKEYLASMPLYQMSLSVCLG